LTSTPNRIVEAPAFSGLHRFYQGCNFKQWTGDGSKACMKVFHLFSHFIQIFFLANIIQICFSAIEGYVPTDIVHAFPALLEFCHLVPQHHNGDIS
ncbi:hypothetical protein EDB19DRAFT_1633659, partial [Suillus lakei]